MIEIYDLLAEIRIPAPEGFWPATITGWITILGFIGSAAWMVYLTGRWAQKLESNKSEIRNEFATHKKEVTDACNGVGGRVSKIELDMVHDGGRVDALEVQMSRTQGQYEALITLLGEAKASVDQFRAGMSASGEKIERKIDDLRRDQNDTKLHLSERLKAVETILEHQT